MDNAVRDLDKDFERHAKYSLTQNISIIHSFKKTIPEVTYFFEMNSLCSIVNVSITRNMLSCDCFHFGKQSLCKHLLFLLLKKGDVSFAYISEQRCNMNNVYWNAIEMVYDKNKVSVISPELPIKTSTLVSSLSTLLPNPSTTTSSECTVCLKEINDILDQPVSCFVCTMKVHTKCLYEWLLLSTKEIIPSSFNCFQCAVLLPLVAVPVEPPPLESCTSSVKKEEKKDLLVHDRYINTHTGKSPYLNSLHPHYFSFGEKIPFQTSLTRYFNNNNNKGSNKKQKT